ncbi:MAG: DNA polymerase I [Defluviitaleaceae bacterium]|nr:DNA polymerase I [Defluviitaleaceae bacterium]
MSQKILLVDGFSILNRAFYALPLFTNSSGEYTNAVYGFLSILMRFHDEEKPDFITVAFDLPKPTFRHERYAEYKATRKSMPEELIGQVPTLKNLLTKMNINISECPGYEADDVIGTLAVRAEAEGISPVIVSGDRDLLQLATETIRIRLPKTKAGKTEVENYYAADVEAKYGVTPAAYIDVKALMGDSSDNVPGVPGIGEVTATKIITAYGNLENAIANAAEIKPKKASENLAQFAEQARLSRELVTIRTDVPVDLKLTPSDNIWNADVYNEVKRLEMKSLYRNFTKDVIQAAISHPSPFETVESACTPEAPEGAPAVATGTTSDTGTLVNVTPPKSQHSPLPTDYPIIHTKDDAAMFFACISGPAAFFTLYDDKNTPLDKSITGGKTALIGMGIALHTGPAQPPHAQYLYTGAGLSAADLLEAARPWLESDTPKWALDIKAEITHLRPYGITPVNICFDAKLAAYVINTLEPQKQSADIALTYLDAVVPTLDELLDNKGKRGSARKTTANLSPETAAGYAAGTADIVCRCHGPMQDAMAAANLQDLYEKIELPLATVLAHMEGAGIQVNPTILTEYGKILDKRLSELTDAIYESAGEPFNIQSPIQLGEILFEKLGLKGGKKTTRGYSTAADVLEKLVGSHPIIPLVMEYRAHAKLKSTYVEGLLPLINPETSRIHSTFHQALTATGRISSAEPNLQNIPVRMPLGRELRKAFVPRAGHKFVDADYSQIELRVLAHISGDETLITAFKQGQDIHRLTASQVLGIPPEEITPEQRNNAKAVNFGIIYGISAFGLSEDIGVHVKEAERYIAGYFEKYPKVKSYLDETIITAKKTGYVSTLYNRRRAMPELKSPNFNQRAFGTRVAMNMPIQGTAADIIKIAMINVHNRLARENLSAKLILQVHDELLLEVPEAELTQVKGVLKEEMENAANLKLPLVADVSEGESWYETK